jgi:hypothetical protein
VGQAAYTKERSVGQTPRTGQQRTGSRVIAHVNFIVKKTAIMNNCTCRVLVPLVFSKSTSSPRATSATFHPSLILGDGRRDACTYGPRAHDGRPASRSASAKDPCSGLYSFALLRCVGAHRFACLRFVLCSGRLTHEVCERSSRGTVLCFWSPLLSR